MQFYAFIETKNNETGKRVTSYWNRKAKAWESALSADCAYPTARGAAQRANAWAADQRKAFNFGEFAYGFAIFPRA